MIPKTAVECQYCGQKYKSLEERGDSFNTSMEGVTSDEQHESFWKAEKRKKLLILLISAVVVGALIFGIVRIQNSAANSEPVEFSTDLESNRTTWVVITAIEEPEYVRRIVSSTSQYPDMSHPLVPREEPAISQGDTVFCKCTDQNGTEFWIALEYGDYQQYFGEGIPNDGIRVLGESEKPEDLLDRIPEEFGDGTVFVFAKIEP